MVEVLLPTHRKTLILLFYPVWRVEEKTVEKVASNIATILESANLGIPIGPNLAFIRSCFTEILTKK